MELSPDLSISEIARRRAVDAAERTPHAHRFPAHQRRLAANADPSPPSPSHAPPHPPPPHPPHPPYPPYPPHTPILIVLLLVPPLGLAILRTCLLSPSGERK
eukprot:GHVU01204355.1.p1 GENE.GHVU01204355.1~~GHVU01204355.1.p1  ORF type:complete len:102 (-),score=7.06 GHVU01204355.1:152-457(-)